MRRYVENINLDALEVVPGSQVVDVGCADGHLARALAAANIDVIGVEPEQYLRDRFQRHAATAGPGRATVVAGTVEQLPFDSQSVSAVTITEVLEHVDDPGRAMAELHRIMRPGGVLCLSVPTAFTERLFWRLHPQYPVNTTHVRIFTRARLSELIRRARFEIVTWEGRNAQASISWIFHSLLRSHSDHAGNITEHLWVDRVLGRLWAVLRRARLEAPFVKVANRLLPKSWYVYCRRM
jgi:SAM-dependent methyltransferase